MTARHRRRLLAAGLLASLALTGVLRAAQEKAVQEEEILGGTAAFDLEAGGTETVWIDAGIPLFERPDASAPRLEVIDFRSELEVLERQGEWCKVRYAARLGWVHPELPFKDRVIEVELDLDSLATSIPAMKVAALGHLEFARRLLGATALERSLGPYDLLTDVRDEEMLDDLHAVAEHLDSYYRERYNLELGDTGQQTVALFSAEDTYREFERQTTEHQRQDRQGHAIGNVAGLFVGDKRSVEFRPLLAHELTHLINRRAFGSRPPAWIEEGIANDVAYCKVDRNGRPRTETLAGESTVFGSRMDRQVAFSGGLSSLTQLLKWRARRRGTPLDRLIDLSHDDFMAPDDRQQYYIESAFLIRLLLDGPKDEWRAGFRSYLAEVADGELAGSERLIELLGTTWTQVELTFDSWLKIQSVKLLP